MPLRDLPLARRSSVRPVRDMAWGLLLLLLLLLLLCPWRASSFSKDRVWRIQWNGVLDDGLSAGHDGDTGQERKSQLQGDCLRAIPNAVPDHSASRVSDGSPQRPDRPSTDTLKNSLQPGEMPLSGPSSNSPTGDNVKSHSATRQALVIIAGKPTGGPLVAFKLEHCPPSPSSGGQRRCTTTIEEIKQALERDFPDAIRHSEFTRTPAPSAAGQSSITACSSTTCRPTEAAYHAIRHA
ncbi:hypothetical protein CKAH01_01732 [Colletotrichum kahawae]|uniref:Uncharacterized protein n=1 Tax=Colletotrichum kahawae TaxID=34407 RepID=A0AAD9Y4D5_COLKA|nr:hypothetical protein CKAH01_01732 [Colletotrichum kahawae]